VGISLASALEGWSAVPGLLATALAGPVISLRDPIELHLKGAALQPDETAPRGVIAEWCQQAQECLQFLAATDPARIWIWQEQVLPLLVALSPRAAPRHAGLLGEAQPMPADAVQCRQRRCAAARSHKTGAG
jgi:hypothetical protein